MTRRSFSLRLLTAAVTIALAPRLAFKDAPEMPAPLDTEFRCVIRVENMTYLRSEEFTIQMPAPEAREFMIENFSHL